MSAGSQTVGGLGETSVTQTTEAPGAELPAAATVDAPAHTLVAAQPQTEPAVADARIQRVIPQGVNDWLGFVLVILGLVASAAIPFYALYIVIKFVFTH